MPSDDHAPDRPDLLAVAVGNTRTRVGLFRAGQLDRPLSVRHDQGEELAGHLAQLGLESGRFHVAIASVREDAAGLVLGLLERGGLRASLVSRLGKDLPIPVRVALRDASTVGQDRLLNALGAYRTAEQACVVIDAGTAVTVDFIDGQGVFQGGVIAPGLSMMLAAMHEHTSALPKIEFEPAPVEDGPLGKDTPSAMRLGVVGAVLGLVRYQLERYADLYGAYPQVIATGGDAARLFEHDEVVEHVVPDLQLMGIHAAVESAIQQGLDRENAEEPDEGADDDNPFA